MPSSRSATAVQQVPRRTSAETSATPSAGSVTCTDRTTVRGGVGAPGRADVAAESPARHALARIAAGLVGRAAPRERRRLIGRR